MTTHAYDKEITALLVIDPYNDFISEGGKLWGRVRSVAEANDCVPHMLRVLNAAREGEPSRLLRDASSIPSRRLRDMGKNRPFRKPRGRTRASNMAPGAARCTPGSSPGRARSSPRSIGARADSRIRIWICNSRDTACSSSSPWGSSRIPASKRPFVSPLSLATGVTVVRDATADYSDEEMHAALDINIPRYASAIVTTNEIVDLMPRGPS